MANRFFELNESEHAALFKQDPAKKDKGSFQRFMVKLQTQYRPGVKELKVTEDDLETIPHLAFDYGGGGWEKDLKDIFERHLGPTLGRDAAGS